MLFLSNVSTNSGCARGIHNAMSPSCLDGAAIEDGQSCRSACAPGAGETRKLILLRETIWRRLAYNVDIYIYNYVYIYWNIYTHIYQHPKALRGCLITPLTINLAPLLRVLVYIYSQSCVIVGRANHMNGIIDLWFQDRLEPMELKISGPGTFFEMMHSGWHLKSYQNPARLVEAKHGPNGTHGPIGTALF